MREEIYDLVVIGAGAGGCAAALTAARLGLRTLLVERDAEIGGTAVRAGVSVWEPSVSGTGLAAEIYARLAAQPGAVGVYSFGRHLCWPGADLPYPGAELRLDPARGYADTLRRHGTAGLAADEARVREQWHGVIFEPTAYARTLRALLREAGCTLRTRATVVGFAAEMGWMHTVTLHHRGETRRIHATAWVDATADVAVCRQLCCAVRVGTEGRAAFDEPDAPDTPSDELNGITLLYRLTRDPLPAPRVPAACWWHAEFPAGSIAEMPGGGWLVNMLPTMDGAEFAALPPRAAYRECRRRVFAHAAWLRQAWPEFRDYGVGWVAPRVGVREGPRIVAAYTLTEHDLLAGLPGQTHPDIIAVADHPIDLHGSVHRSGCQEVAVPYGIPFRCLVPEGWKNLLVACRGAGFTHIAAAAVRLTRTMISLGQAAGTAVALAREMGVVPAEVPGDELQQALTGQGVG